MFSGMVWVRLTGVSDGSTSNAGRMAAFGRILVSTGLIVGFAWGSLFPWVGMAVMLAEFTEN